jgi:hypothetical protein
VLRVEFLLEKDVDRASLPELPEERRRDWPILTYVVPSEIDFQPAVRAIIREASYPAILNGSMCDPERTHDVITVDHPMPALTAPMRLACDGRRGQMVLRVEP